VARRIASSVQQAFIGPQLERHLNFMESELAVRPWFAGAQFSAADVQMSFPLEAARSRAGLDARRPKLVDFLSRIRARSAYQRALERGGPYGF
jgi:glutathione S-transferase